MGLPDRPGDQLAAEIQALRADVPIVIASGRSGRELREQFAGHSRVAILVKPYTAELLLEALAEVGVTKVTQAT
jgi:CheY-like chemotaxis protein